MRHRSEQFRRRDGRHRQRAAHPADDRDHPGDDASGDAAAAHNLAGKHEERHREQRKIVEAAEHIGLNRLHRHMRGVPVVNVMRRELIMPPQLAGVGIDRQQGTGVEIVAVPIVAVVIGIWIARAVEDKV